MTKERLLNKKGQAISLSFFVVLCLLSRYLILGT
jgi:hypothetical protein